MPAPAPVIGTSVGRCLLEARKARGLTISDVAQAIKFSPRQIEAIESRMLLGKVIPGSAQARRLFS